MTALLWFDEVCWQHKQEMPSNFSLNVAINFVTSDFSEMCINWGFSSGIFAHAKPHCADLLLHYNMLLPDQPSQAALSSNGQPPEPK